MSNELEYLYIISFFVLCIPIIIWFIIHNVYAFNYFERNPNPSCITQLYCNGEPIGPSSTNHVPQVSCITGHSTKLFYQETTEGTCPRSQFLDIRDGTRNSNIFGIYEYNLGFELKVFDTPTFFEVEEGVCYYLSNVKNPSSTPSGSGVSEWIIDYWDQVIGVSIKSGSPTFTPGSDWTKVDYVMSIEKGISSPFNLNTYTNLVDLVSCNTITTVFEPTSSYFSIYSTQSYDTINNPKQGTCIFYNNESYGGPSIFITTEDSFIISNTGTKSVYNPVDLLLHTKLLNKNCENATGSDLNSNCFCIDPSLVIDNNNTLKIEALLAVPNSRESNAKLGQSDYKNTSTFFQPKSISGEPIYRNEGSNKFSTEPNFGESNGIGSDGTASVQQRYSLLCGTSTMVLKNNNFNYDQLGYDTKAHISYGKYNKKLNDLGDECGDIKDDKCKFITFPNQTESDSY